MAAVPDFGSLAAQQNTANNQATNLTNQANRPDQYNALGSTTWSQDGAGNWTNSSNLNGGAQNLFNSTLSGQQNLTGQIGAGLNSDGLMGWGSTDLTGNLGAMPQVGHYNQQVINAWNALQQPGLQKQADASRQRLAAQGITNGSTISNNNEGIIGGNWNDASNKAILAGYQQGNTEYDQALRGRQQGYTENLGQSQLQNSERAQQFGERQSGYQAALSGLTGLTSTRNSLDPNAWNSKVPTSAAYIPQTIYGAAQDTFNANMMNENAATAAKQANQTTAVNAGRALLGNQGIGGLFGSGGVGGAASGLWNWGSNAYNGYTADNFFSAGDANNWGGNWTPGENYIPSGGA